MVGHVGSKAGVGVSGRDWEVNIRDMGRDICGLVPSLPIFLETILFKYSTTYTDVAVVRSVNNETNLIHDLITDEHTDLACMTGT